jgi:hypothetical protein
VALDKSFKAISVDLSRPPVAQNPSLVVPTPTTRAYSAKRHRLEKDPLERALDLLRKELGQ